MADAPYIGSGLPAKVVETDGLTTLFDYAETEMGDALQWWRIADLNGLSDFVVPAGVRLKIPAATAENNDGLPFQQNV